MSIDFDSRTGALRLHRDQLDALVAIVRGDQVDRATTRPFADAGMMRGGRLHPALVEAMAAVVDPRCEVALDAGADRGPGLAGYVWVAGQNATAVMPNVRDDLLRLATFPPGFVPLALATMVDLGPRPALETDSLLLPVELVDALFGSDLPARDRAAARIQDSTQDHTTRLFAALLAAGPWRQWTARAQWTRPNGEPGMRALTVVDTAMGLAVLESHGYKIALDAASATQVWYGLTLLLPSDDELG